MKRNIVFAFAILTLSASTLTAQVGQVWIEPVPRYSQTEKYVGFSVQCFNNLVGLKGIHLDLDYDPSIVSLIADSIRLGDMFVDNDSVTFFYNYIISDSSRLTVDIAVLEDSATVSGPGNLLFFTMYTKIRGESDILFASIDVRDRYNQPIATTTLDGYIKVCQYVGDVNDDNEINIADLVYLVAWSFKGGATPTPQAAGDIDCNSSYDIGDITALVDYMFRNGTLCGPCINN